MRRNAALLVFSVGAESIADASRRDLNRLQRSRSWPARQETSPPPPASPANIAGAMAKDPELASGIEGGIGKLAQLKGDLNVHRSDRAAIRSAMPAATASREKENSAFEMTKSALETNLAALAKASAASEEGAGGTFAQTEAASALKSFVMGKSNMYAADRNDFLSLLSGSSDHAPASGQVTGILQTMRDDMTADLIEAVKTEGSAVAVYHELTQPG